MRAKHRNVSPASTGLPRDDKLDHATNMRNRPTQKDQGDLLSVSDGSSEVSRAMRKPGDKDQVWPTGHLHASIEEQTKDRQYGRASAIRQMHGLCR